MAAAGLAADKKGACCQRAAVAFLDETGHTFRARVGTTWAPRGQPPVLRRVSRRREVSSIVLLLAPLAGQPARLLARHFLGTIHTAELLAALRYFHAVLGRLVIVVWDHLNVHRADAVGAFVATHPTWFRIEWLPGYAPELNPEEQCNQWVKHDMLHALPLSVEDLRQTVRGRFVRLAHQPDMLGSFFTHAALAVN